MVFMREAGCEVEAVVMKTDNEPALVKVVEEVGRLRAAKGGTGSVVENNPVHLSRSNGYIEISIRGGARDDKNVEEQPGRKVGSEAGCRTSDMAVAGGMDRVADVESGGRCRREDRIREV
jgi:hypothetical protein